MHGGGNQALTVEQGVLLLKVLGVLASADAFHKPILVMKDNEDRSVTGKRFIWDETMQPNDSRITNEQRAYTLTSEWDLPQAFDPFEL